MPSIKIILFFLVLPIFLNAQSPYDIDWKKEPYIIGLGVGAYVNGYVLQSQLSPLTLEEILALDRADINKFDRNATFKYSTKAGNASDVFLYGSYGLPALFLFNSKTRSDFGKIMIIYGETLVITKGLTILSKRLAKRPRPFVYNELVDLSRKQTKQARYSFFSGHVSVTSANCFFTAKVFSDYYPDSTLKPYVWASAAVVPAVVGFLRVQAGKHFYSDVITGYSLGAVVGFMIPHLHKVQKDKPLTIYPSSNGAILTWNFNKR